MDVLKAINGLIIKLENRRLIRRTSAFLHDYHKKYPHFALLESNARTIERECRNILQYKSGIPDMNGLAGRRTVGGIHAINWKSFMLKSGSFIEENCRYFPETSKLLRRIPGVKQAFFSILDPEQHIKPHKGYYQGFLRYHLGVIIPDNNSSNSCWIRINDDPEDNRRNDKSSLSKGETYYWKNGEGIMFNDNYLHEAANESKEIRVVLFLDVVRKFPFWFNWVNALVIGIGYQLKAVKQIAKNARVNISEDEVTKQ